jgi:CubicO group peptidase (beta-lactamase class C family)
MWRNRGNLFLFRSVAGLALMLVVSIVSVSAGAAPVKYNRETQMTLKAGSKFKISAGWSYDDDARKLSAPENNLVIYLRQEAFKGDPVELSQKAWKSVKPDFNYKIMRKVSPPAQEGWEQIHQINYDVPSRENKSIFTLVRVYKNTAYIMLVGGSNATLDMRGAQLQIVVDTWRPAGMQKEDLSHAAVAKFKPQDALVLDRFIEDAMNKLMIPGAQVAVVQDDKVVYRKCFGVKCLGAADKVTPETLFMIGSTTKPLTTLMLSCLVAQGKLTWDTPVKTALPAFELQDSAITPRFLIRHTACACTGMPRRDMEEVFGSKILTIDDTLKQLHSMKPTSGFGETFQYSNQLVAVGGLAGASVYNKGSDLFNKYENAMNDFVFAPLKMSLTRVRPRQEDLARTASPHARGYDGKMVPFPQKLDDMVYPIAPAGSVWSNTDDLCKYVAMELRDGKGEDGSQLFSAEQIAKRRTPGVKVDEDTRYGLGLFIENDRGASIIHHAGNTMGFTSHMLFLPKQGLGMVILTNAGGVNGFRNALKQKLLEIFLAARPRSADMIQFAVKNYNEMNAKMQERVSLKPGELAWIGDYVGRYESKELGPLEVTSSGPGHFQLKTPRWVSELASEKEPTGEKLLALTSAPWWLGELRVQKSPVRKLILDDAQVKYEFVDLSAPGRLPPGKDSPASQK